jgi:hypothetical protein
VIVPEHPAELLVEFLPRYFAELAPALDGVERPARESRDADPPSGRGLSPAPAGVAIRVVEVGVWTLSVVAARLVVEVGVAPDVALQVSLHGRDFGQLVVAPLKAAVQVRSGEEGSMLTRARASSGFWSRLGRWDAETVELLRRQTGRILVRVDDAGTSLRVALTPGVQPYSLDEAECYIDCRRVDLEELQAKRASPLDLFYSGQIRITGDAQIALAMAGLFL